jgi:biopolymer transport protein ExbD
MLKKFKNKQLDQNAIPTTSLADMMFLLLIFFIMTTTLSRVTGITTEIPSSSKGPATTQEKTPTVSLHDDRINVEERQMTMKELRTYIKGLHLEKRAGEGKVVILSAAGSVKYQRYYETVALIQTSGGVVAIEEDAGKGK